MLVEAPRNVEGDDPAGLRSGYFKDYDAARPAPGGEPRAAPPARSVFIMLGSGVVRRTARLKSDPPCLVEANFIYGVSEAHGNDVHRKSLACRFATLAKVIRVLSGSVMLVVPAVTTAPATAFATTFAP